jgi:hypothetical protein
MKRFVTVCVCLMGSLLGIVACGQAEKPVLGACESFPNFTSDSFPERQGLRIKTAASTAFVVRLGPNSYVYESATPAGDSREPYSDVYVSTDGVARIGSWEQPFEEWDTGPGSFRWIESLDLLRTSCNPATDRREGDSWFIDKASFESLSLGPAVVSFPTPDEDVVSLEKKLKDFGVPGFP